MQENVMRFLVIKKEPVKKVKEKKSSKGASSDSKAKEA
jgi:ribosomal protein S6